jgi:peptidyl-prolyl cis-trans isomerase SurA
MACKARIEKGEDFAFVAKSKLGSEDPSVVNNGGDLGYFTAFQMVYPFEDKAYNTPVGKISDPVRTRFGYHIIKVTDKRPARGTIKVAHLMIQTSKSLTEEQVVNAEKKINELYDKLVKGESWDELVKAHSEDPGTQKKNGELPMFGSGTSQRMVPAFEDAAFSLKKDGEFSKPVKTDYGFHIIKRLEWKDIASFETLKKEIQTKVNKDERAKKTQDSFVEKLKKQYKYKSLGEAPLTWFDKNIDSTYYIGKWKSDKLVSDLPIFELSAAGKKFTQKELLKEYHDGIILYEIMSDKVWNKATKDTAGLRVFFEQNRDKYMWPKRFDAVVYECSSAANATTTYKMLKKKKNTSKEIIEKLNATSELNVKVKMNKLDPDQYTPLKDRLLVVGRNKPYEFEGKHYVVDLKAEIPVMRKELSEARGLVTSDYQNFLEKNWMEEITRKHTIKVNYDILYNLNK